VREGVGVTVAVMDGVGVPLAVRLALSVCDGVTDAVLEPVGVSLWLALPLPLCDALPGTDGVMDGVAPVDRDAVGVALGDGG
jgi:hypothetical protein